MSEYCRSKMFLLSYVALTVWLQPVMTYAQQENSTWRADSLAQRIHDGTIEIQLQPNTENLLVDSLGWSPKGTKFPLREDATSAEDRRVLAGAFSIGDQAQVKVQLAIKKSEEPGKPAHAVLQVDANANGEFEIGESSEISSSESRGKTWYSGSAEIRLPTSIEEQDDGHTGSRSYPVSLWYVEDPTEPESELVMRWSRQGWHLGIASVGTDKFVLVVSDRNADGVFTDADAWGLQPVTNPKFSARNSAFSVSSHAWLDEIPYRLVSLDRFGKTATIEAFDLGRTRKEDEEKTDPYAADRKLPRADRPVEFLTDFDKALKSAKDNNQLILIDFVTTWCGPCRVMDQLVYTATSTVDACRKIVCVKLDGDEHKDLAKRFEVEGYPTLLLVSPDGEVVARRTGYQGVKELVAWIDTVVTRGKDDQ